jgi:hypothetical protein
MGRGDRSKRSRHRHTNARITSVFGRTSRNLSDASETQRRVDACRIRACVVPARPPVARLNPSRAVRCADSGASSPASATRGMSPAVSSACMCVALAAGQTTTPSWGLRRGDGLPVEVLAPVPEAPVAEGLLGKRASSTGAGKVTCRAGHVAPVDPSACITPTATLVGAFTVGPRARLMHDAVLDAEGSRVAVGECAIVCQHAVLRVTAVGDEDHPVLAGDHAFVGRMRRSSAARCRRPHTSPPGRRAARSGDRRGRRRRGRCPRPRRCPASRPVVPSAVDDRGRRSAVYARSQHEERAQAIKGVGLAAKAFAIYDRVGGPPDALPGDGGSPLAGVRDPCRRPGDRRLDESGRRRDDELRVPLVAESNGVQEQRDSGLIETKALRRGHGTEALQIEPRHLGK